MSDKHPENLEDVNDIKVTDDLVADGYAVITSSAADELSQESVEIRSSFFTHYLVSGLRGAADQSGDGKITLAEAYRYAYQGTVARTSASIGGSQHPMYDFKLSGRGDIVLTTTRKRGAQLVLTDLTPGRVVVVHEDAQTVVAEVSVVSDKQYRIALREGAYSAFWLGPDVVRRADVVVSKAQTTLLTYWTVLAITIKNR